MSEVVHITRQGDIAVVTIDSPPINALSQAVRQGLSDAFARIAEDTGLRAVVLAGAGRTFIAGADIREFGKPPLEPRLPDVISRIEAMTIPVVAVIAGPCLGGGLEVALGAHRRVALRNALLGFPEVTLGLLPGAGGTQRAPRLIGVAHSLDLITTGRRIGADEALALGLVDRVDESDDAAAVGLAEAQRLIDGEAAWRRTGDLDVTPDPEAIASARTHLQRSSARLFAPHRCVDAVEAATLPLSEGLKRERELFMDCMASPQRQGLIHAFFAERAVADVPEAKATPRDVGTVGVIGGGTMGAGIATALLQSGLSVIMIERDAQALAKGRDTVASALDGGVKRGKMTAEARNAILADKFSGATDHAALAQADLIIEAVFESMDVKRDVFASLDRHARPGAILATNTSYLDIDAIAAVTSRPQDVIGLHFFSPAHVMKLLEIVVPARASAEAVATGFALAKRMKKIAVRAGVCDGFIGNRILAHYRKAADYMMLDGASPYEIDAALRDFGFAMGPYEVADLAGLDIGWATRKRLAPTRDPKERYVAIADRICENGWFGRKTGQGFYLHEKGGKPQSNPAVEAIIADERARSGMAPRHFSAEEIVTRYMTAMANESARVVEDGIALRPIDVDAVKLFGYGFPRHEGGPLAWADRRGLAVVLADTARLADTDPHFWRQPALMRALAERDADFASLNKKDRT